MKKKLTKIIIITIVILVGISIGYVIYDVRSASKRIHEIQQEVSDHTFQKTGVNTESLDAIRKKLDEN